MNHVRQPIATRRSRPPAKPWRACAPCVASAAAAVLVGCVLAGCAWTRRGPVADNVIASRELSLRGMEAMERGQWEEAENLFARAIDRCPTDQQTHTRYAEALWQRGSVDLAIHHLEEAVKLSGGDAPLLVQLGEKYLALGDLARAAQAADQAIAADHQLAAAWGLRGDVFHAQQHLEEALTSYHRALGYQPNYPHVQLAVARIYQQTDRPQRALTTLETLAEQFQRGTEPQEVLFLHGLALKRLGRYTEAVDSLAAASQRGPRAADILYHLGDAQLRAGDYANARLSALAALDVDPRHVASQALKSRIDDHQQRMTAALPR